ncbi:hypothetical protein WISP_72466 [Willisornis vidua]|uniref:Uncharacterized protein n=1 Tax=Willisornis vidua TaxID=1566151 RepID=A0ABQ9D7U9_9PASS|nr:hypothetical protein WISP_72466 [Willisornis vidua]
MAGARTWQSSALTDGHSLVAPEQRIQNRSDDIEWMDVTVPSPNEPIVKMQVQVSASRGRKPFGKTLELAPAKLVMISLPTRRRKTRHKDFSPKSCISRLTSVLTSPATKPDHCWEGQAMDCGREGEQEFLNWGFLKSFWDDETGLCLTSDGKFFGGLSRDPEMLGNAGKS